ncbi:hypothetical protein BD779DRAFT_714740 [Infundibulicybe gibba]|nr:hypothetical protein BD779DRAFT_714740 [Infundibulicybe gibba]
MQHFNLTTSRWKDGGWSGRFGRVEGHRCARWQISLVSISLFLLFFFIPLSPSFPWTSQCSLGVSHCSPRGNQVCVYLYPIDVCVNIFLSFTIILSSPLFPSQLHKSIPTIPIFLHHLGIHPQTAISTRSPLRSDLVRIFTLRAHSAYPRITYNVLCGEVAPKTIASPPSPHFIPFYFCIYFYIIPYLHGSDPYNLPHK